MCQLAGHKWFILASQGDLHRGERLFRDHGGKIVLLGRMVPIPRFVLLTAIGSGIWNALFISLGWYLQENYEVIEAWLGPVGYVVVSLIVAGLGWLALRRLRSRDTQVSTKPSR